MCFGNFNNFGNFGNFVSHVPGTLAFDVHAGGTDFGGQVTTGPYTQTDLVTAVTVASFAQGYDIYRNAFGGTFTANLANPTVNTVTAQVQFGTASDNLYLSYPNNEFTVVYSPNPFPQGQILQNGTEVATFNGGTGGVTLTINIDANIASNYGLISDIVHGVWYQNASGSTSGSKNVAFSFLDNAASNTYATVVVSGSNNVTSGQIQTLTSGQTASGSVILANGLQVVSSGGAALSATLSGGVEVVSFGGATTGTTISNGGAEYVSGGGIAVGTTLDPAAR
jgi:autotransporter passenger strand-loop-strand repeat protein